MPRDLEPRERVHKLLEAARRVYERRAQFAPRLVEETGLSAEGVELGFTRHLELHPSFEELSQLVSSVTQAPFVHVILSANVFVASLRAIALACAASPNVSVRPSRRESTFAAQLVQEAADLGLMLVSEQDVACVTKGEIHVYGRDETIESVRSKASTSVKVRGHGQGFGVACVSPRASLSRAASHLADDVIAFDQRGCLSPRVVLVEGARSRAEAFAQELSIALNEQELNVPRGALSPHEKEERARYEQVVAFAGAVWKNATNLVGMAEEASPLLVPPPGRHVHVAPFSTVEEARGYLAPFTRWLVAFGTDAASSYGALIPPHARVSLLGDMQRPRFDGPVDRRPPFL